MEKSWIFAQSISSTHYMAMAVFYSLHLQVHYFLSLSLSCMYYNVCVVVVVAVRGGHLYYSKLSFNLWLKCTFDFVDNILTRPWRSQDL